MKPNNDSLILEYFLSLFEGCKWYDISPLEKLRQEDDDKYIDVEVLKQRLYDAMQEARYNRNELFKYSECNKTKYEMCIEYIH